MGSAVPNAHEVERAYEAAALPSVGVAGVWMDPDGDSAGHDVLAHVAGALRELGVYGGYREAFPSVSFRLVRRLLRLAGRPVNVASVMLTTPMQVLSQAEWFMRRLTTPRSTDAWIQAAGQSVSGRYATLTDQSPRQILHFDPERPSVVARLVVPGQENRYLMRKTYQAYRRAYVSCAASHWAAASIIADVKVPRERVKVVGFGVGRAHDPTRVPLRLRDWNRPRFLFVGGDWKRKNGDSVIRAFRALRSVEPLATLHVVGGHPRLSEDGVFAYGTLSRQDPRDSEILYRLFGEATSLVMPSVVEPFGHVHVEAGSAGIGSIGTTEGGAADAIGPGGGLLVDPRDDQALLDAMHRFCDPVFAAETGRNALRHSRLLGWDLIAQRILRALDIPVPGVRLAEFF